MIKENKYTNFSDIPQHLYHYTKLDCLEKIFNDKEGKNVHIQFTDLHFVNDIDEGIYFYKFLEDHKNEIVQQFENDDKQKYCKRAIDDFLDWDCYNYRLQEQYGRHYSFSLSELRDSMYFWQTDYAKENGIALSLDTSTYLSYNGVPSIEHVHYLGMDSMDNLMSDFAEKVIDESRFIKYQDEQNEYGGCQALGKKPFWIIKAKTWKPEKEWRMVKSVRALNPKPKFLQEYKKNIKEAFMVDYKGVPRYYLDMPNPFTEIILGPTFSDYYVTSIKEWLKEHKYEKVTVTQSVGHVRPKR